MPYGTFPEDVYGSVMVTVKYQLAVGTLVCSLAQTLLHSLPTTTTLLRCELRGYCYDGYIMQCAVVLDPLQELAPSCVVN